MNLKYIGIPAAVAGVLFLGGFVLKQRADEARALEASRQAWLLQRATRGATQAATGTVSGAIAARTRAVARVANRSMKDVPPPRLFRGLRLPAPVLSDQEMILEVVDDLNRPIEGARVSVKPDPGCGTAVVDSMLTDAAGRVRATWTMGTRAGVCSAVTRVIGSERFPFVLTVVTTNGPAGRIELVRGANQQASFGGLLPDFIEVEVHDRHGNVARNAPLRFTVISGGGRIVDYSAVPKLNRSTNLKGLARVVWRLGPSGPQRMEVRALGSDVTARPLILTATGVP